MASLPVRVTNYTLRFGLVGLSGLVVNQLVFALFTEAGQINYLFAAILATQVSTTWNFLGIDRWAFRGRPTTMPTVSRYLSFLGMNNLTLILRVPLLWLLAELLFMDPLLGNLITLLMLFVVRYLLSDGWIWKAMTMPEDAEADEHGQPALRALPVPLARSAHVYDIAGVLRVESDIALPELRYFRTEASGRVDIRIRVSRVGALPSRRTHFRTASGKLSYIEHLGLAGANFRLTMGDPIDLEVAPLLARSPHVLYTNVVEALLRFVLVARGHVLLHSASLVVDGKAALLSAQTDTGKTSTVIRLVRERGYHFLSDDMTIIAPDGRAICYPKPMTLSYHTMSAIAGVSLSRRQRLALALQSRLHSKSGRSVGRFLGDLNIPIMSVNSVVQMLVPPPKYHIDALLGCKIGHEAPIGHVVLMERGEELNERLTIDRAVEQLIENTDDAYGFPPFATFAPHIRIGGDDDAALRAQELQLLRAALLKADLHRLRVPGHDWADLLPELFATTTESDEDGKVIPIPIQPVRERTSSAADAPIG
jgi:putative flippase GtrA